MKRSTIIGSGSYIPQNKVPNADFHQREFYTPAHERINNPGEEIANKFQEITGIRERRYADPAMNASDLGYEAAKLAIQDSGIDPETIDQIICATNFGDVKKDTIQCDFLPAVASRIKHLLKIQNPFCVAYDVIFGCPGWVQGLIQSDSYLKSGEAKTTLVIGAETLSRVIDPYDRDSMIFSDGAGATVIRYQENDNGAGILSSSAMSHTTEEAYYLFMGASNLPDSTRDVRYIKMHGRKVYEYALTYVPQAMKHCLDKAGVDISEVKKIFIHQANEKLDEGVIKRLYRLYGLKEVPRDIMPMSVHLYGNSSVATVPTLFDEVVKGHKKGHRIEKGDVVLFASVGAGMNINAVSYRV